MEGMNHVRRRCTWVEGHCMLEIFNNELTDYVGYRCICGKEISKDTLGNSKGGRNSDSLSHRMMFMSCTGKQYKEGCPASVPIDNTDTTFYQNVNSLRMKLVQAKFFTRVFQHVLTNIK